MDKFLCAKIPSDSSSSSSGGLLALMKKSRDALPQPSSSSFSSSSSPQQHRNWESLNSSTNLSLGDVHFQTRHQKFHSTSASKGWRVVDGEKVYVTMRTEGVVRATGREAFLLSKADAGKGKRKSEKSTENANIDTDIDKDKDTSSLQKHKITTIRKENKLTDHFVKQKPPQQKESGKKRKITEHNPSWEHVPPTAHSPVSSGCDTTTTIGGNKGQTVSSADTRERRRDVLVDISGTPVNCEALSRKDSSLSASALLFQF